MNDADDNHNVSVQAEEDPDDLLSQFVDIQTIRCVECCFYVILCVGWITLVSWCIVVVVISHRQSLNVWREYVMWSRMRRDDVGIRKQRIQTQKKQVKA